MAKTTRKCHYEHCRKDGDVINMVCDLHVSKKGKNVGKETKRYFHPDCYELHLKLQEVRDQDIIEIAKLDATIKRIHGMSGSIGTSLWTHLSDIRNGTIRKGGRVVQKYKEGIKYSIIEDAYILAEDSINWARANKKFAGKDEKMGELKYCLAIVQGKISLAYHRWQKKKKQDEFAKTEESMTYTEDDMPSENIEYKKRDNKGDISQFLND